MRKPSAFRRGLVMTSAVFLLPLCAGMLLAQRAEDSRSLLLRRFTLSSSSISVLERRVKDTHRSLPTRCTRPSSGYGFDFGSKPVGVERGGADSLTDGFVTTSEPPFFFSVKVPEGQLQGHRHAR